MTGMRVQKRMRGKEGDMFGRGRENEVTKMKNVLLLILKCCCCVGITSL